MQEILSALDGLLPRASEHAATAVHGSGRYWSGPLDVQRLAVSGVGLAVAGAQQLARTMGHRDSVITARLPEVIAAFGSVSHLRLDGQSLPGFAPCSGFFPVSDGWLRTHANYPHHRERLFRALDITHDDALAPALAQLTGEQAESRIVAEGGIAARVATEQEWRVDAASEPGPWLELTPADIPVRVFDRAGSSASTRSSDSAGCPSSSAKGPFAAPRGTASLTPLAGVRVVSLTRVIAGPTATKFLAALGADVLRIDPPALPELLGQHLDTDAGVRCVSWDLADPTRAEDLADALDAADVLLTGYRPGSLTDLGLDAASIRDRFPHLVHVELSAWEPSGTRGGQRGFDSIVQAATGIAHHYGARDEHGRWRPGALPVQALDHTAGYGMAAAACALLATGTAGHARVSLERTARALLDARTLRTAQDAHLSPATLTAPTDHGMLEYVPSPVRVDGARPPAEAPRCEHDGVRGPAAPARTA